MNIVGSIVALLFGLQAPVAVPPRPAPEQVTVADGVYLFKTAPYGEVGLDGNAVAIVTTDGVVVFDSNGTPTAARAVIAAIKRLTSQPVRYVVNSHWHWDHWNGTEAYRDAFPDVRVIAHERTRAMMAGPAVEFNRPGLESQLPEYLATLEARNAAPERIAMVRWFMEEKRRVRHVLPDQTYTGTRTLTLGGREMQLVHVDRAVSPGDTMIWLPKERVLLTGDVLINPVSFALSVYPEGWIRTLEWIDARDAAVLVPGHGDVMRDETKLHATTQVLNTLRTHGREARAQGKDQWTAADEGLALVREPMLVLTGDHAPTQAAFRTQLVEWFMARVYDELAGPMTDAIAAIPSRPRR